jgi:hypothetical protein
MAPRAKREADGLALAVDVLSACATPMQRATQGGP